MEIIYIPLGIIVGAVLTLFWVKNKTMRDTSKASEELAVLRNLLESERKNVDERIATIKENLTQQLDLEKKNFEERITTMKEVSEQQTTSLKESFNQQIEEKNKNHALQLEAERKHNEELCNKLQKQLDTERRNAEETIKAIKDTTNRQLTTNKEYFAQQLEEVKNSHTQQLNAERKHSEELCNKLQKQLEAERKNAEEAINTIKETTNQQININKEYSAQQLNAEHEHNEQLRNELKKQAEAKNQLLQEEVRNMAAQMLAENREKMNTADKERLNALLSPLKERIEAFNQTVTNNSKENAANKTEIKTSFEAAMKQLHAEQEMTIKAMLEGQERTVKELRAQTDRIGNDAASLTKALKGDSKMQGDWGEMILEKTLEDCGLVKDQQFFLQENFKDEDNNNYRPDAVIVFPNDERAVVDSKVSLTAYQAAIKETDDTQRDKLLKEHVTSVRKHIDELSAKNYEKIVPGCIGYVLMFVPYESGYSAAIKGDPSILQYAFRKHIIVLSPSNLLMALQLTRTMWQNHRLNDNVDKILQQSNDLYDKFSTFAETFLKIGSNIERLQQDFNKAKGQLNEGKGNIVRRLEGLKTLGISPKKQIPENL